MIHNNGDITTQKFHTGFFFLDGYFMMFITELWTIIDNWCKICRDNGVF